MYIYSPFTKLSFFGIIVAPIVIIIFPASSTQVRSLGRRLTKINCSDCSHNYAADAQN